MEEIFLKAPSSNNLNGSWIILEWLINEGDIVQIGDKILRLDDGKFHGIYESYAFGKIHIIKQVGETVLRNENLAILYDSKLLRHRYVSDGNVIK